MPALQLTDIEFEQVLRLALAAARTVQASPAVAAAVQTAAAPAPVSPVTQCAALPTLNDWLVTYEQIISERGYDRQTIKNRGANLKHLRALLGTRQIAMIRPHDIAVAIKTLSPSTATRVLLEARDVFFEAIANGAAEHNPAALVKGPKHPGLQERLRFETWQAMRMLAKTSPQRRVESMLLLGLVTGQRRADLAKMRFDDVVTDASCRQYLRVEQQKKAGKPIGARVEIPLDLRLDAIGMSVGDVIEHCRNSARPGPTLLRCAGGGAIEMSSLSARFHEHLVTVVGQDAFERYHAPSLRELRSLAARMYLEQGLTRQQVQTLLGHANAEMTDVYLNDRGLSAGQWKRVQLTADMH